MAEVKNTETGEPLDLDEAWKISSYWARGTLAIIGLLLIAPWLVLIVARYFEWVWSL